MTDDTELQCLIRLRRLAREIAASLQADIDHEQVFQVPGPVHELLDGGHLQAALDHAGQMNDAA
jgi:hypothetical protein